MIALRNVTKTFKRVRVLDGLELHIDRGERVALVGSNGAGKTTLIRCLLGEYVCAGSIKVDGMAPRQHRKEVLSRIGFVPQLPPPLKLRVGQIIRFVAALSQRESVRMETIAARLGLEVGKFRHQPFDKLSGGQKQKLLIAIAMGRETDILVLDEPAANLDPDARHKFFELLAERQNDAAIIISSHRLDEVASLVNRVVELDQGKVVLDDKVADTVDLSSVLSCRLRLIRSEPAVSRSLKEWGFLSVAENREWEGVVAGPDRLRFLGMLSRYAALLAEVNLVELSRQAAEIELMSENTNVRAVDAVVLSRGDRG